MDSTGFDAFTRTVGTTDTRRALLRLVATLPVGAGLAALLGDGPEAAAQDDDHGSAHRRKRRKRRHDPGQDKDNRKGKRTGKGKGKS